MASNAAGTPQAALYAQRPVNTTRDRSMEQNNTNSGNPYGYAPQYNNYYAGQDPNLGRYAPPQGYGAYQPMNFQQGPYAYNSPNNYGTGTAPSGQQYTPQYAAPPGGRTATAPVSFNTGNPQTSQFQPANQQLQAYLAYLQNNQNPGGIRQAWQGAQYAPQPAATSPTPATAMPSTPMVRGSAAYQPITVTQPAPAPAQHTFKDKNGVVHQFGHLSFSPRVA